MKVLHVVESGDVDSNLVTVFKGGTDSSSTGPRYSRLAPSSHERLSDDESDARSCDSLQPSDRRRVSLSCKRITIAILNGIDFCIFSGEARRKFFKMNL